MPALPGASTARVAGYVLLLAFFSLGATSNGFHVTFRNSQTSSSPGELNFWLGHAFLLFPACLLLGYGLAAPIGRTIARVAAEISSWGRRQRTIALVALTVAAFVMARVGRALFLLDLPITDDELAVEFGGRVLATGRLMTPLMLPPGFLPDLFLLIRDGKVGSFDWPGGVAISALGEVTRLGVIVWTLLAIAPVPILARLVSRRLGSPWGWVAALLFLCSPMALLMSMTSHAQLASRALFALALLAFDRADRAGGLGRWTVTGLAFGLAFLCRPIETAFFSLPIAAWAIWRTTRGEASYRTAIPGLALGALAGVLLLLWHSYAITGNPLLPARFASPENTDVMSSSLWTRFGDNVTYNLLMLAIWFLGPLGVVLVAAGVLTDRFTRLLGACVLADLCLAFFHDNPGLHIVGPIHYSECAVPLAIIATYGVANILAAARRAGVDTRMTAAMMAVPLVLGLGIFTIMQGLALRDQATVQRVVYDAIEKPLRAPGAPGAVVLAPWLFAVTSALPPLRDTGTWVHDWRRPQLDLSDEVLFLRDVREHEAALRAQLPDRRFYRLARDPKSGFLALVPLAAGDPIVLSELGPLDR